MEEPNFEEEYRKRVLQEEQLLEQLRVCREGQLAAYIGMAAGQMTAMQCQVVLLDRRKSHVKDWYEQFDAATEAVRSEYEVARIREALSAEDDTTATEKLFGDNLANDGGPYWQDELGLVYAVKPAKGKYVPFKKFEVVRTKRDDEQSGDLSLKEAREHGFEPANAKAKPKARAGTEADREARQIDSGEPVKEDR
jgi:hypothetical protein